MYSDEVKWYARLYPKGVFSSWCQPSCWHLCVQVCGISLALAVYGQREVSSDPARGRAGHSLTNQPLQSQGSGLQASQWWAQEGRVGPRQDAGWINLHSWRGWSPKVRAAFNGVAAWEETASQGAFIMLGLWINSGCCTLGSQVLVIKNVNRRIRLGKEQFSRWTFLTGCTGVLLPPPCFYFRQRALHPMSELSLLPGRNIWM